MTVRTILVMGGAHVDRRGRIAGETAPGASNPGAWFVEAGGGAFNAARNLARLGHQVRLVSPRVRPVLRWAALVMNLVNGE